MEEKSAENMKLTHLVNNHVDNEKTNSASGLRVYKKGDNKRKLTHLVNNHDDNEKTNSPSGLRMYKKRRNKRKLTHLVNNHDDNEKTNSLSGLRVYKKRDNKRSCSFVGYNGIWLLNNDVMIEILSRIPIESVPNMKHACKWWYYLSKSHSFRCTHFQKCQKAKSGIFLQGSPSVHICDEEHIYDEEQIKHTAIDYIAIDKEGKHKVYKNKLDFLPEKVVITASFNGLLVCRSLFWKRRSRFQPTFPQDEELVIYVCNPLTKEFNTLKPNISKRQRCWIGLTFNSFDSFSTCFELLVVQYPRLEESCSWYVFKIFSSKTNKWRISEHLCYYSHRVKFIRNAFSNGIFYWLTAGGTMLTFDLETEKSHIIELPLPVLLHETTLKMCLGESDGYIHFISVSRDEFRVWILNSDTNSKPEWRMKYFGHLFCGDKPVLVDPRDRNRIALSDGDRLGNGYIEPFSFKDDVVFMRHGYSFCVFDLKTGNLEKLCSFVALSPTTLDDPLVLPYGMSVLPVCNS